MGATTVQQKICSIVRYCLQDNFGYNTFVKGKEPLFSASARDRFNDNVEFYLKELYEYTGTGGIWITNLYYDSTEQTLYVDGVYTHKGKSHVLGYLETGIQGDKELYEYIKRLEVLVPKYYMSLVANSELVITE